MPIKRIYYQKDIETDFSPEINPMLWTAVVPAAGRGSRLGFDKPKILFPVAGKPILEWLVELLSPYCGKFVFILSPSGKEEVVSYLADKPNCQIALQEKPVGMADAVLKTKNYVKTRNTLVIWGDQVGIKSGTVLNCIRAHEQRPGALLTCPTIWRKDPYIHFQRDNRGKVEKILHKREGDRMGKEGENDCGLFLFRTSALFNELEKARTNHDMIGMKTKEFNLLPIIPYLDRKPGDLACLRIVSEEETIGINTQEESRFMSKVLQKRKGILRNRWWTTKLI